MHLAGGNDQQIAFFQGIDAPFHGIGDAAGEAEDQLMKLMVMGIEIRVPLVRRMKQAIGLMKVAAIAGSLHSRLLKA